jgi:hypothetical protein
MLIVLSLLGIISLALIGLISFGINARDRVGTVDKKQEELSAFRRFLNQELAMAYPDWKVSSPNHIDFEGKPDHITFLGPAPQAMGRGFAYYRLGLEKYRDGNAVELQVRMATDTALPTIYAHYAIGINNIRFKFFGSSRDSVTKMWQDEWVMRTTPPDLIALSVSFPVGDRRSWPLFIIHPEIDADMTCKIDDRIHQCAGR